MATADFSRAQMFSALGDPTREAIVGLLAAGPLPVHRLASRFPVSRPAVSRHLRLLKEAGIVGERRRGRERAYFLRREALGAISEWVEEMESAGGAVADSGDGSVMAADDRDRSTTAAGDGTSAAAAKPHRQRRPRVVQRDVAPPMGSTGPIKVKGENWKAW